MTKPEAPAGISLLGNHNAAVPHTYAPEILEALPNTHLDNVYLDSLVCPASTSICPITA